MSSERLVPKLTLAALMAGLLGIYGFAGSLALNPRSTDLYRRYYIDRTLLYWPERTGLGYAFGQVIAFDRPVEYEIRPGWSHPETQGTWTVGPSAGLLLRLAEPAGSAPLILTADLSAFVTERHPTQAVEVEANGVRVGHWDFRAGAADFVRTVTIPPGASGESGTIEIRLRIGLPASPKELGLGTDRRKLGVIVRSVRLDRTAP